MKATFDIPDDLYRSVAARSAREGRPVHAVAIELLRKWAEPVATQDDVSPEESRDPDERKPTRFDDAPWLKIAEKYVKPGMSHDWDAIKGAIAIGWGEHAAGKPGASELAP